MKNFCMWLLAGVLLAPLPLCADLVVFSDKTVFLGATAGAVETLIPNSGLVTSPANVGNLTFSLGPGATQLYFGTGNSEQWSTLLPGNDIALSGTESLNVNIAMPVYGFGFGFHEPSTAGNPPTRPNVCNAACVDSTFQVTLKAGALTVGSFSFNAPNDVAAFVGVLNSTPFNRVEIRERGGNDNEFYGSFYTSTVPEPSTWLLLTTCLGLTGAVLRRRRS